MGRGCVADLQARSAGAGRFPIEAGGLRATEVAPECLWLIMPFCGREAEVAAVLPCGWPEPGRVAEGGGLRAAWFGRGAVMLMGPQPKGLDGLAALTDQTDAWCVLRLDGEGAEAVLARLVPIDLRPRAFPEGSAARTLLGHMGVAILRGAEGLEILCPRSMASTLAHELDRAMRMAAARGAG